jgi:hypothetical protein
VGQVLAPGAFRTTNDGKYDVTELLKSEPVVDTK